MALDPYSHCPCGSGKKLKFCCADLMGEMEKISRMLDGDQRAACLQHIKSLLGKLPDRASLLGLRVMLELELGQLDDARQTVDTFLEKHPENPVALAASAMLLAETAGGTAAVEPLQRALGHIEQQIPNQVYDALGYVGLALLEEGKIAAARAHLLLQARMGPDDDTRALELLARIHSDPQLHVLLKDESVLALCPDDVDWKGPFDAAMRDAMRGTWRRAAEGFQSLLEPSGGAPAVWKNLSLVRNCLGDIDGMIEASRGIAGHRDVPQDDAIEAEALAQLLEVTSEDDSIDHVQLTYPIRDSELLTASLSSDERTTDRQIDKAKFQDGDEPPPSNIYQFLDRAIPETGVDTPWDEVPRIIGHICVYGKQTDRESRLELVIARNDRFDATVELLGEICGDAIGELASEEVEGQFTRVEDIFTQSWILPADTPPEHQRSIMLEAHRQMVFQEWLNLRQTALNGLSPVEAARDDSMRIKTLAAILVFETSFELHEDIDMNELRTQLGLPVAEPIDPTDLDVERLSLAKFPRLMTEKLSDDDLIKLFRRATMIHLPHAVRKLAKEIVGRESLRDTIHMANACGFLASLYPDPARKLELLAKARHAAQASGRSCAAWDLRELVLRLQLGHADPAQKLTKHLSNVHLREPGVRETLIKILVSAGLLHPDETPVAAAQPSPHVVTSDEAASQPGQIWTPDRERDEGEKPAIWTPGDGP